MTESPYSESVRLFERAQQIIPGGIHLTGTPLLPPNHGPLYMERGLGCRCWDVDGNEYIDYLMAFGPFLLGYANAEVDLAAMQQLSHGKLVSMNHRLHIQFVERLLGLFPETDMGIFFKTGSEATTAALRLARRYTGRRKVARCGYHGWHDWCLPLADFVPGGLDTQVLEFAGKAPHTLARIFEDNPDQIAAVILAPEMLPSSHEELLTEIQFLTREAGAVFILDEVKTAFRIKPGSMQQYAAIQPDITTLSKALGNGWPVAAVVGRRAILQCGAGMHYSATFHGDTASLAAALKVLDILEREPVAEHVWNLGERLIEGLNQIAQNYHVPAEAYGEPLPPMPFLAFKHPDENVNQQLIRTFYTEMLRGGILLHPRHMWFISYSHKMEDIDRTLIAANSAMARAAQFLPDRTPLAC